MAEQNVTPQCLYMSAIIGLIMSKSGKTMKRRSVYPFQGYLGFQHLRPSKRMKK